MIRMVLTLFGIFTFLGGSVSAARADDILWRPHDHQTSARRRSPLPRSCEGSWHGQATIQIQNRSRH